MSILKVKKMFTSFAFSKPAGKYILSYTLKNILNYIQQGNHCCCKDFLNHIKFYFKYNKKNIAHIICAIH